MRVVVSEEETGEVIHEVNNVQTVIGMYHQDGDDSMQGGMFTAGNTLRMALYTVMADGMLLRSMEEDPESQGHVRRSLSAIQHLKDNDVFKKP